MRTRSLHFNELIGIAIGAENYHWSNRKVRMWSFRLRGGFHTFELTVTAGVTDCAVRLFQAKGDDRVEPNSSIAAPVAEGDVCLRRLRSRQYLFRGAFVDIWR